MKYRLLFCFSFATAVFHVMCDGAAVSDSLYQKAFKTKEEAEVNKIMQLVPNEYFIKQFYSIGKRNSASLHVLFNDILRNKNFPTNLPISLLKYDAGLFTMDCYLTYRSDGKFFYYENKDLLMGIYVSAAEVAYDMLDKSYLFSHVLVKILRKESLLTEKDPIMAVTIFSEEKNFYGDSNSSPEQDACKHYKAIFTNYQSQIVDQMASPSSLSPSLSTSTSSSKYFSSSSSFTPFIASPYSEDIFQMDL